MSGQAVGDLEAGLLGTFRGGALADPCIAAGGAFQSVAGNVQGAAAAALVPAFGSGAGRGLVRPAVVPPLCRAGAGGRHAGPLDDLSLPRAARSAGLDGAAAGRADPPARASGRAHV